MPRIPDPNWITIQAEESRAAVTISQLAAAIQEICYLRQDDLSWPTQRALHKCYRVLFPVVGYYLGDRAPLHSGWQPPDFRFQKAKTKC